MRERPLHSDDVYREVTPTILKLFAGILLVLFVAIAMGCSVGPLMEGETLQEYREAQSARPSRQKACESLHGVGSEYCK